MTHYNFTHKSLSRIHLSAVTLSFCRLFTGWGGGGWGLAGGVPQPCPNLFTWGPPSSSSSPSPKLFKFVYLGSPNPDLFSVGKRVAGLRLKRLLVSIISAELYLLCPWKRKIFLNILVPNDPTEWISKIKWSLPFLYTISWFSSIILKIIKIFSH